MAKWLLSAVAVISLVGLAAGTMTTGYRDHPEAQALIERMVEEHDFDREALEAVFAGAERKQGIIDAISRPAERVLRWHEYRNIFIQEKRIDLGAEFWRRHADTLERAEREFGVDPAMIVAIIGVETYYGRIRGGYRVIDALSTLAFDYPPRSPFFTKELENFLLLTRDQERNPHSLVGSYAGAMGYGQFMPSSYRHYAVDFDGDGKIDIWDNPVDAIGSVANYFAEHGWQPGQPVVVPAEGRGDYNEELLNKISRPELTVAALEDEGFVAVDAQDPEAKATPLRLELEDGKAYYLGYHNFYVITRYNRSHLYAMAVYELSELIRERVGHVSR